MNVEEHVKYWLDSAENDLDAAEKLFSAAKYDWCLFIGHLVVEKTLKHILFIQTIIRCRPRYITCLKLRNIQI